MKKLISILFLLTFATLQGFAGANVVFNLGDFTTGTITNRQLKIEPQSTPRSGGANNILSRDSLIRYSDTSGTLTVTNMAYGNYLITLLGPYAKTEFRILVPDTNGTLYADALLVTTNSVPSESAGYSQTQANRRFVLRNSGWASNLVVTNLTLPVGAVDGYVWTASGSGGAGTWAASTGGGGTGGVSIATVNLASNGAVSTVSGTLKSYATNIATLPSIYTNVVYVNATGTVHLPTVKAATPRNSLIVVGPGTYSNATNLLKDGVDWWFMEGAKVYAPQNALSYNYIFGDQDVGAVTSSIYGRGEFWVTNSAGLGSVLIMIEPLSRITFHCKSSTSYTNCQTITQERGWLDYRAEQETRSYGYDTFVVGDSTSAPTFTRIYSRNSYADNTILEVASSFPNPGDCVFSGDYAEITPGSSGDLNGLMMADNVIFDVRNFVFKKTEVITGQYTANPGGTGNGVVLNCRIVAFSNATASIVQRMDVNAGTAITFRGCTIEGPIGRDPIDVTPGTTLTLEDCNIIVGASATNSIRASSSTAVKLAGVTMNKGLHANITRTGRQSTFAHLSSTGITNTGAFTNSGTVDIGGNTYVNGNFEVKSTSTTTLGDVIASTIDSTSLVSAQNLEINGYAKDFSLTPGALLMLNSANDFTNVTLGAGLSLIGTTLSGTSSGTIGAGAMAANANQFDTNNQLNIKTGALLTNVQARGITDLNATVSRAAAFNASGNLTNATTTAAELDFVSGVTSAIQTQLNGKQSGLTNGNQFGATTTTTIKSGALVTNVQARGVTDLNLTASRAVVLNASGNLTNATTTAAELDFVNGVTSAIQTQLNGKQNGQTNGNQFGASTTLTIASGALTTNAQIRGVTPLGLTASRATFIDASGNLTNVTSGSPSTEYVKADGTTGTPSGGTGSTNPVAFAAGSVYVTNSFQFEQEGMILRTTNMWADGGLGSLFTNVFAANLGGVTNILATNILDGQTITLWVWADTGVTVGFPQFAATNFVEGSSLNPATNAWSMVEISRQGTRTNINVTTPGLSLEAGSGVTFSTNFVSRTLTVNATGSGGGATTNANQFGATADGRLTLKDGVMVTNLAVYGTNIALFPDQNTTTTALLLKSTTNNFFQGVIKNQSSGSSASSDWVAEADNGSDSTHYIDMGINGSGGGGTPFTTANHAYLYAIDDPLQIGSLGSGGSIGFYVTGGLTPVEKARIQTDGQFTVVSNIAAAGLTITNAIQARGSNFLGTLVLPNLTTNRLLMTGGGSNAFAVTLGSGLQLTSGTLSSSLATNGNQFGATATLTLKPAAIITNQLDYIITANTTGVGGANTNFTLLATNAETTINGFTNVSIRAVMSYVDGVSLYWTCLITNGSGSDRTLEFSAVTNRFRFAGTYGTNAPSVLTNATQLLISGRSLGTNTLIGYSYFAWP